MVTQRHIPLQLLWESARCSARVVGTLNEGLRCVVLMVGGRKGSHLSHSHCVIRHTQSISRYELLRDRMMEMNIIYEETKNTSLPFHHNAER